VAATGVLDTLVSQAQTLSMATSMPNAGKEAKKVEVAGGRASLANQSEGFSFIERNRTLILASPLFLAAIMIVLNLFAGKQVHYVIDFLTSVPQR
jgi:hypothetical protein